MSTKTRRKLSLYNSAGERVAFTWSETNKRLEISVQGVDLAYATSSRFSILGQNQVGDSSADLVGFYGATPISQPSAAGQSSVASTALTAVANTAITTTPTTTITSVGSTSLTALDVTRLNALIARVEELRVLTVGAVARVEEVRVQANAVAVRAEAIRVLQDQTRTDLVNLGLQKGS